MTNYIIQGGHKLKGHVTPSGNKNSVLKLMAACLLTSETCVIKNAPIISDVEITAQILETLGATVRGIGTHTLTINCKNANSYIIPSELATKIRSSIVFLGPLLARFGQAKLIFPGGDQIGKRGIGTHIEALKILGTKVSIQNHTFELKLKQPQPGYIFLDEASVTATENIIMLAANLSGTTIIDDAACEPHITTLGKFINKMGANITGLGTNKITIKGKKKLKGATIKCEPDPIEIATYAIAAAITKGEITIGPVEPQNLQMILLYLSRMGVKYSYPQSKILKIHPSKLQVTNQKSSLIQRFQTRPWPGFPTDAMSPFVVLATQTKGVTLCHDWMYETRMFFTDRLSSMGANITFADPHRIIIQGPTPLYGAIVPSPDIRAGMALLLAALTAKGQSVIEHADIIERGYEKIVEKFANLGANIYATGNTKKHG